MRNNVAHQNPLALMGKAAARIRIENLPAEALRQKFIVENHAGAMQNVAAEVITRAPAHGYALFVSSTAFGINKAFIRWPESACRNRVLDVVWAARIRRHATRYRDEAQSGGERDG